MKFIFKWLDRKIQKVRGENLIASEPMPAVRQRHENSVNFTIARANGGYVVEYHSYDKRTDRSNHYLHIITDDKDLGEELGKIISFESLRA